MTGVFYYDEDSHHESDSIKSLITILKPKNFCLDPSEFDLDANLQCSVPWSILKQPMESSGSEQFIPIQGTLSLSTNHISLQ
jgi:hypothetical protein